MVSWCSKIEVPDAVAREIRARTHPAGVPRNTQWRRHAEIDRIRAGAVDEVPVLVSNGLWVAGTVMYWGEGDKTTRRLSLSNADPNAHLLFIAWVRAFHDDDAEFVLALHLHEGNDDESSRRSWEGRLGLQGVRFHKTYRKPSGSGQRKNTLPHGICRTIVRRSSDHLYRTLAWIEALPDHLGFAQRGPTGTIPAGR